jgi:hypothetical protein
VVFGIIINKLDFSLELKVQTSDGIFEPQWLQYMASVGFVLPQLLHDRRVQDLWARYENTSLQLNLKSKSYTGTNLQTGWIRIK